MSQSADVPIPPDLSRRYSGSTTGRDWLASLPRLIRHSLDQWQLELDLAPGALPWNGHGAIVIPVRQRAGGDADSSSSASANTRTTAVSSTNTGSTAASAASTRSAASTAAAMAGAAVLKVAFPHDEALLEPHALALWSGRGAVRLLANDPVPARCCWSAWTPPGPSRTHRWTWRFRCGAD